MLQHCCSCLSAAACKANEISARGNALGVFISFFPAFRRFIKHRVSNHLKTPLLIWTAFIALPIFKLESLVVS